MTCGRYALLGLLLSLAACAAPAAAPDVVSGTEIEPSYALISVRTGAVVETHMPDRSVLPASTAKLATALAIIDRLRPEQRFYTRLCRDGDTLALVGGGDPSLDVEDLFQLALDGREAFEEPVARFFFAPPQMGEPIAPDQPSDAAYNPRLAPLAVAEGAFRGHRSADGETWTVPEGGVPPLEVGTEWFAHPDPPRQAALLLRQYWRGLGLDVPDPKPSPVLACEDPVAQVVSPPVSDLLREMLWTSSNQMAENLGRLAGPGFGPEEWLMRRHPDLAGARLPNFSGLSSSARVTARFMATLLAREAGQEYAGVAFPALLTPAGWDGGLRRRLIEPPAALMVWAKTGTMHYGVGLAGYALIPGKGLHAFAVYAFDEEKRAAYDRVALNPPAETEVAAKAWDAAARATVDRTVEAFFD